MGVIRQAIKRTEMYLLNLIINPDQKMQLRFLEEEDKEQEPWIIKEMQSEGWTANSRQSSDGFIVLVFTKPETTEERWYLFYAVDGEETRIGPYRSKTLARDAYYEVARDLEVRSGVRASFLRTEYLIENSVSSRFDRIKSTINEDEQVSAASIEVPPTEEDLAQPVTLERNMQARAEPSGINDIWRRTRADLGFANLGLNFEEELRLMAEERSMESALEREIQEFRESSSNELRTDSSHEDSVSVRDIAGWPYTRDGGVLSS